MNKRTSISIDNTTKKMLDDLKIHPREPYKEVISDIIHQNNILKIHLLCADEVCNYDIADLKKRTLDVFKQIGFEKVPPVYGWVDGEWKLIKNESFSEALDWALEYAIDEDFIGQYREDLPMGEAITNVYCLMVQIEAPTWSLAMGVPTNRIMRR